jgi:hypothetical protein
MGGETIGECLTQADDPALADYEMEMAVKFIKQEAGTASRGTEVQIGYEDSEYGGYPVIVVIWDDYESGYPMTYIDRCMDAFTRFELPEEIYRERCERAELLREVHDVINRFTMPE